MVLFSFMLCPFRIDADSWQMHGLSIS